MSVTSLNLFNLNNHKSHPFSESSHNLDTREGNYYKTPTISIIGLGRMGTVTSACFSKMGFPVIGVDSDKENILEINSGHSHFHEDGLDSAIQCGVRSNTLSATDNVLSAIVKSNITIITINTFKDKNGNYDLTYLINVCKRIGLALQRKNEFHTIIFKSIVPAGTTEKKILPLIEMYSHMSRGKDFGVCFIPDFLRESTAIQDFDHPPITLIGAIDEKSAAIACDLFRDIDTKLQITNIAVD